MKGWQLGALIAGFAALLALFWWVFPSTDQGGPPPVAVNPSTGRLAPVATPTPANQQRKAIQGNASEFKGRDADGNISWTLKASSILMRDAEKKADATDIQATFFSKEGQPMAIVNSRGATINLANNNMQFHGKVVAVDPAGQTLIVQQLRYDGVQKRFYGSGGVRVTRATSVMVSDKMWADPGLKQFKFEGHVQAFVRTIAIGTPAPTAPPTVPPPPPDEPAASPAPSSSTTPTSSATPSANQAGQTSGLAARSAK